MKTKKVFNYNFRQILYPLLLILAVFLFSSCNNSVCDNTKEQKDGNGKCVSIETSSDQEDSVSAKEVSLVLSGTGVSGNNINLVVDSNGNLFYPNVNAGIIHKVDISGTKSTFVAYVSSGGGYANITIDKNDNLYVATPGVIKKITSNGVVSNFAIFPSDEGARQMATDSNGNIYYTAFGPGYTDTHIVRKVTPNGVFSTFAGSGTRGNSNGIGVSASFSSLRGIAIDFADNVFVADVGNFEIKKITPSGVVTTFAGSGTQKVENGIGNEASFYFNLENGYLAVDSLGNLFVGDNAYSTGYIRKISSSGEVSTFCGGGSSTAINSGSCAVSGLWVNMGLKVAPNGSIYYLSGENLHLVK